jgi:hypothetical protein
MVTLCHTFFHSIHFNRAIKVRSPAGAKDFSSSLCVQTGSETHPASCTMGTGGPFPGAKARPGRDADHSPPSNAEVENEYELYLLCPQAPPWRVEGLLYLYRTFSPSRKPFGCGTLLCRRAYVPLLWFFKACSATDYPAELTRM